MHSPCGPIIRNTVYDLVYIPTVVPLTNLGYLFIQVLSMEDGTVASHKRACRPKGNPLIIRETAHWREDRTSPQNQSFTLKQHILQT